MSLGAGAGADGESVPLTPSVSAADVSLPLSSSYHIAAPLTNIPTEHTQHAHTAQILHSRRSAHIITDADRRPRPARLSAPNRARAAVRAHHPPPRAHRPLLLHNTQSQAPAPVRKRGKRGKWARGERQHQHRERQTAVNVMGCSRRRGSERGEHRHRADDRFSISCSCRRQRHWRGAERQRKSRRTVIAVPSFPSYTPLNSIHH